jgi:hypothetical protein
MIIHSKKNRSLVAAEIFLMLHQLSGLVKPAQQLSWRHPWAAALSRAMRLFKFGNDRT